MLFSHGALALCTYEEMGFQFLGPGNTVLPPSDPRPPTVRFDLLVVLAGSHS